VTLQGGLPEILRGKELRIRRFLNNYSMEGESQELFFLKRYLILTMRALNVVVIFFTDQSHTP
jgi:hypothetical protein